MYTADSHGNASLVSQQMASAYLPLVFVSHMSNKHQVKFKHSSSQIKYDRKLW
jgi:hypothetical protein